MGYIIYVIDTETTGLLPLENDVVEVSLCRFILSDSDKSEQKTWCIRALNPATISEKALNVNGHKREDICHITKFGKETYLEPSDVISQIEAWVMEDNVSIDERVFAGQNPEFDYTFLKEFWKKAGSPDTFPFGKFMLDTIAIARFIDICTDKKRGRYNLSNLVKDFGVTKRNAHRAADDVEMTRDVLLKQVLPMKETIINLFSDKYQE